MGSNLVDIPHSAKSCFVVHEHGPLLELVRAFHLAAGQPVARESSSSEARLQQALIREEAEETRAALLFNNLVLIADGIADTMYAVLGVAVARGLRLDSRGQRNEPGVKPVPSQTDAVEVWSKETASVLEAVRTGKRIDEAISTFLMYSRDLAGSLGIDIDLVFKEVHRSNMSKFPGPKRADGKQLRGAHWQPPDIEGALQAVPAFRTEA